MQFTIANLLKTTTALAMLLALGRAVGFELYAIMRVFLYAIAPVVAFLVACLWPTKLMRVRIGVACFICAFAFVAMLISAFQFGGRDAIAQLAVLTPILWVVEWVLMAPVYFLWKAGINSCPDPPRESNDETDSSDPFCNCRKRH